MHRWYSFLNKQHDPKHKGASLHEHEVLEKDNLIICQKLKYLSFGKFNNYLEFAKYMIKNTSKENRCFYELIPGSASQKPYFDIEFYVSKDISEPKIIDSELILPEHEADLAIEEMLKLIQEEIPPLKDNRSHIFVFTSHKDTKRSYHIVIEGYCFSDNKSNRLFSEKIVRNLPEKWRGIVDSSMYKSSQQFRIAGSCKFGTDRFKTLNEALTINGYTHLKGVRGWVPKVEPESEDHKMLLLIEASLITQTSGSILMPSLLDDKEENSENIRSGEKKEYAEFFEPLTSENIKEALTLCYKLAGLEYGDGRFPYSFMRVVEDNGESSIILLKRRFPSMCRICNYVHENENPYLLIIGLERDVYLDCRRNSMGKKLFVGKLGLTEKAKIAQVSSSPKREEKSIESCESESYKVVSNDSPMLPPILGVPSFVTKPVHIPDLMTALSSVSQLIAPKIKLKEKKVINKDAIQLNFKF